MASFGATPPLPNSTLQFYDGANSLGGTQNIVSAEATQHQSRELETSREKLQASMAEWEELSQVLQE